MTSGAAGAAAAAGDLPRRRVVSECTVAPRGDLATLSAAELGRLRSAGEGRLYTIFRNCALAVLNTGTTLDDAQTIFRMYADFDVQVLGRRGALKLRISNAPASAFVDGVMIEGIRELLFAVLRDVLFMSSELASGDRFDLHGSEGITNAVFHILRNAGVLRPAGNADLAVCWGGHAISREEYDYTKQVGYALGLRGLDICTGCGPGAMKGPMKGATIAHAKQRTEGRYIGLTEPDIIAAEPPNPIVDALVILPDIEKRLEAFVRLGHAFIVFPGGVGTLEEILYLLGILLHPHNADRQVPLILTAPRESAGYFTAIDDMIRETLGPAAANAYQIVIGDPEAVARRALNGIAALRRARQRRGDAGFFDWQLRVPSALQQPFQVSHAAMAELRLVRGRPVHALAADLRRAFSGFVAGNVKQSGIEQISRHGPFRITGDAEVLRPMDRLLERLVAERRMRLHGDYEPCYEIEMPASGSASG